MLTEDELRVKVSELVAYARDHISMNDADRIYVTNILLDFFNLTYPAPIPEKYGDFQTEIIDPIVRHAIDTGRIKPEEALLFETKVLGIVTPVPAEIISEFDAIAGNKGVQKATTWLFELSKATFLLNHLINFNAKRIQDEYKTLYSTVRRMEKQKPESERSKKSNLRIRVRMSKKHTLMSEWYREKYCFGEIVHDTLSRDYKYTYSPKIFNREPTWAKENGKLAEKRLGILREQNDLVHSMRKILYRISELTANYYTLKELPSDLENEVSADILALAGLSDNDLVSEKDLNKCVTGKTMEKWLMQTYESEKNDDL